MLLSFQEIIKKKKTKFSNVSLHLSCQDVNLKEKKIFYKSARIVVNKNRMYRQEYIFFTNSYRLYKSISAAL